MARRRPYEAPDGDPIGDPGVGGDPWVDPPNGGGGGDPGYDPGAGAGGDLGDAGRPNERAGIRGYMPEFSVDDFIGNYGESPDDYAGGIFNPETGEMEDFDPNSVYGMQEQLAQTGGWGDEDQQATDLMREFSRGDRDATDMAIDETLSNARTGDLGAVGQKQQAGYWAMHDQPQTDLDRSIDDAWGKFGDRSGEEQGLINQWGQYGEQSAADRDLAGRGRTYGESTGPYDDRIAGMFGASGTSGIKDEALLGRLQGYETKQMQDDALRRGTLRGMIEKGGYDDATKSAIAQQAAGALAGKLTEAQGEMKRNLARTGAAGGFYGAQAKLANQFADTAAGNARQNQILFADKAREDRNAALQGLTGMTAEEMQRAEFGMGQSADYLAKLKQFGLQGAQGMADLAANVDKRRQFGLGFEGDRSDEAARRKAMALEGQGGRFDEGARRKAQSIEGLQGQSREYQQRKLSGLEGLGRVGRESREQQRWGTEGLIGEQDRRDKKRLVGAQGLAQAGQTRYDRKRGVMDSGRALAKDERERRGGAMGAMLDAFRDPRGTRVDQFDTSGTGGFSGGG